MALEIKSICAAVNLHRCLGAICAAVFILSSSLGFCDSRPWWDVLPREIGTKNLQLAIDYHANIATNGAGQDPGWGLWWQYDNSTTDISLRQSFEAQGIKSLSYYEGYGTAYCPIVEINGAVPAHTLHHFWNWQAYSGGTIKWAGAWTWFDDADFARPYTRTHPQFGGSPMTYPDGVVATGFFNNDPTDPRNSRVYDAGCSKNILGVLNIEDYVYNEVVNSNGGPYNGLLYIAEDNKYSGLVQFQKDSACPHWLDHAYASTKQSVALTSAHGTWTDNMSPWNSFFVAFAPVNNAFGDWSVARFRTYLQVNFLETTLRNWGVLGPTGTYADLAAFDVRQFIRNIATTKFGWDGTNLKSNAWKKTGWRDEPVWRAYCIFKRQIGTQALVDYYNAVKLGAAHSGNFDYFFQGNDTSTISMGWLRGTIDQASTELGLGWNASAGPRGFGLPPYSRLSPFYKVAREMAKSRFVNVWLYNDGGYADELELTPVVNALYYEMLATHTMPRLSPEDPRYSGNPVANEAFFRFVADNMDSKIGNRVPIEDVGVYFSSSSMLVQQAPGCILTFDSQPHGYSIWGWATALSELHYQYRIVPEWTLTRDVLGKLKILIIPHAEVFDPDDIPTLDAWVRSGGILIVTGDSGARLGESGNFNSSSVLTLSSLTGVSNWASAPVNNTQVIGSGRVRFIKENLGLSYYEANASTRSSLLQSLATELSTLLSAENEHCAIASINAPKTVGLTLYEDPDAARLSLDINNMNVSVAPDGLSATHTPSPAVDVTIYKPAWWNEYGDSGLTVQTVSPDGPVDIENPVVYPDRIEFRIPSTNFYTCVFLTPSVSVGAAKGVANGGMAATEGIVTSVFDDCFYIEDSDRSTGIRVEWSEEPVEPMRKVGVTGQISTDVNGERAIIATSVLDHGASSIKPLGMSCRSIGGGDLALSNQIAQMGVEQGSGLNNIGLLVKIQGSVTHNGGTFFCVSDGSEVTDASGAEGVRVLYDGPGAPVEGTFVTVTGISTIRPLAGGYYRCIRPVGKSDIQTILRTEPIGVWDFEGSSVLDNKVTAVNWEPLILNGTGAAVNNGQLVLPRYISGSTWYQSSATAMLKSDLGSNGYFKEMTQVAWVYWPGFTSQHYGRLTSFMKFSVPTYSASSPKVAQSILYGGYSSSDKWRSYRRWEYVSGENVLSSSRYLSIGGVEPPTDKWIKIAQVLHRVDASSYEVVMYWDTGTGLQQLGSGVIIPASEVSSFGQYDTYCLEGASGGKRYDGFGIMDSTSRVPAVSGSIYFEEIRLYPAALTVSEIESL